MELWEEDDASEFRMDNMYQRVEGEVEAIEEIKMSGELRENDRSKLYVFLCAAFASLNSVLLGYDIGVMSGAIIFIQRDLNISDGHIGALVGILNIISLLGSLAAGMTSDAIGRKWTIALAAIIFQTGAAIMALAPSFGVLLTGRLLAGIGIGYGVMIVPAYISEIAPSVARGTFTSFPEIFINIGILLGYISNYSLSGLPENINWRIMLAVGILPSILLAFAPFVIPESPRWLVVQNRIEEARLVLSKTNDSRREAEEELAEIQKAAGIANAERYEAKAVWRELLNPTPAVRRMLIAGIGIQCLQQMTGMDTVVYYSPFIFKEAGIKGDSRRLAANVAVGLAKTMTVMIVMFLIDKVGRKPLLYASTIGMTASLLCLSLALSLFSNGQTGIVLAFLLICGDVMFFPIGIGPICWVLSAEIFPLRLRAQASALGAVGNRVTSGLLSMSFTSVSGVITVGGTFFVLAVISFIAVAFVYWCVPETKGKSLEQIEAILETDGVFRDEMYQEDTEHQHLLPKSDLIHSLVSEL